MMKKILFMLSIFVIAALLSACGYLEEIDFLPDTSGNSAGGPTITAANPQNGSKVESLSQVELTFSEEVSGADTIGNYALSGSGAGSLTISSVSQVGDSTYRLTISGTIEYGSIVLTVSNVEDLAGNSLVAGTVSYLGWWNTDWQKRRKLTFNNIDQTEDLLNFPVLVKVDDTKIDYAETKDNGEDIRFVDADGAELKYEIEEWDESGESMVWVKVAQIDQGSDTDCIWIYYGNGSANDNQDAANVWDSDYIGVWHLNEQAAATHSDATNNNNDGSRNNNTFETNGVIAGAQQFDGNNDYVNLGDVNVMDMPGYFTVSLWFKRNSDINGSSTNHNVDNVFLAQSSTSSNDNLEVGTDGTLVEVYVDSGTGGADTTVTYNAGIQNDIWYFLTLTYDQDDTNELKLYINGNILNQWNNFTGTLDNSAASPIAFGIARPGGSPQGDWGDYDGILDEVRISGIERSGDWINAQHLSMIDTFISFGPEE